MVLILQASSNTGSCVALEDGGRRCRWHYSLVLTAAQGLQPEMMSCRCLGWQIQMGLSHSNFFQAGWISNQYCSGRCTVQFAWVPLSILLSSHMGLFFWEGKIFHTTGCLASWWEPPHINPLTKYYRPGTPEFYLAIHMKMHAQNTWEHLHRSHTKYLMF